MRSPLAAQDAENVSSLDLAAETKLIRASLLMLLLMTTALGGATWNSVQEFAFQIKAIPVVLFVVVCVIVAQMYVRAGEIAKAYERSRVLAEQDDSAASQAELQQLLQTVTASRESFRDLIDSFGVAVFTLSLDGKLRTANKRFQEILGRPFPQLIGSSISDLISEPSQQDLEAALPSFLESRHWSGVVRVRVTSNDEWRYFDCTLQPVLQDDEVVAITVIADDITAAREREALMQRRLAEEQEFREQLVACLPDALVTLDTEGRFTFATGRAQALFGKAGESLINRPAADFIDPQDALALHTLVQDTMNQPGLVASREVHVRRSEDGAWRTLLAYATALHDHEHQVIGVVASLRDVTEERHLEQHLVVSERMAAIGQLIEGFAYELNNPLTAILGACELLKTAKLPSELEPKLDLLGNQTRRACEIVHNLQLFAPAVDTVASVSVADLIHRTVALRRHSLRTHRVSVSVVGGDEVPNAIGNPAQLMQVFMNLLIHGEQACRAGEQDGGNIRICIGHSDKDVWCTFQHDGPGINVKERERIFDPFFTSKQPGAGIGLGLSVCRSIVHAHGGKISACAAPDGASIFYLALPATPDASTSSTI